jgi:GNAT superfamily N-acetyltransferase
MVPLLTVDMDHIEHHRGDFLVTTDPTRLDVAFIHSYLVRSYWAEGIPREVVERSIANSLCFGAFEGEQQVGFARVITDYATFAYLADVFIIESHRGRGLSKFLMECIVNHPELQGLRRWILGTRDAHALYAKFGFTPLTKPDRFMELHHPEVYKGPQ